MKHLLSIIIFLSFMSMASASISTSCVSESGMSIYDLYFDLENKTGEIKYRFMDQEIYYKVHITSNKNNILSGVALFNRSNTGETKGTPFEFQYDQEEKLFSELNLNAICK